MEKYTPQPSYKTPGCTVDPFKRSIDVRTLRTMQNEPGDSHF
jgi:hypothetical protein